MPRHPRIHLEGIPQHVVQRGHNCAPCFFENEDYDYYLHWLGKALRENACSLHAYVLMTNHVHLLLSSTHIDDVAKLFMSVGRHYVQFVNKKYGRSGTLWEGRYRSSMVDTETYVMNSYRYIELNPVRARMVDHPEQHLWSSYRANALGEYNPLITAHEQYHQLAPDAEARQAAYRELFNGHLPHDVLTAIRNGIRYGKPVGNPDFLHRVEQLTEQSCVVNPRGRPWPKK
jgi:putative transposase